MYVCNTLTVQTNIEYVTPTRINFKRLWGLLVASVAIVDIL